MVNTGIRRIKTADTKVVEHEGKYIEVKENEKEYPAKVTNFALKYGIDKGLIKTTDVSELVVEVEKDFNLAISIIYLGVIGANPVLIGDLDIDKFTERLDYSWQELTYVSQSVLLSGLPDTLDEWIAELEKMTVSDDSDSKKK